MGKLIVLTGATRGLGRALTGQFVAAGHRVAGCGRSIQGVHGLKSQYGPPHDFDTVDVANSEAIHRWAQRIISQLGPPDILINNAAVMNPLGPLWALPREAISQLIDVNIKGVTDVIQAFVPAMAARQTGVIVNLSSGWGRSTAPEVAPYCASKYAIEGLSLAMAQELPKGMACVPLNPGIIDTDMLRQAWGDGASSFPDAEQWAQLAGPYILQIGAKDNGKSLTVR